MHVGISAMVIGAAAAATVACGSPSASTPAELVRTFEPSPAPVAADIGSSVALPPNADGDPPCPAPNAWGKDPFGAGVLVTHWSDDTAPVTILVRTRAGSDQAQGALLGPGELRLFEFPDVDEAAVSEVLIMTKTRRCYVPADPAALG